MLLGAWLVASGGCNCLIDADKYRGGPAGDGGSEIDGADNIDGTAPPDGRIESDAGPIEPTSAREGEGSGTGAPPVVIVLRGEFAAGSTARVVRSGDGTDLVAEPAVVASDGSMLAIPIRVPVYEDLAEDQMTTLEIYVDEGSGETLADTFLVDGLDELDLPASVDTTTLRPLYSRITASTAVAFTGASPAILRSTTDIDVGRALRANGKQGGGAGPGGCTGGGEAQPGNCDLSGGTAGASGTTGDGGGGGGHAQDGNPGTGGASGGQTSGSGDGLLTPLVDEGGHGGGGGGGGLLGLGSGGEGGGGGGIVELTAGGTITVAALVDVSGGNGVDGAGICGTNAGGSGGGGSGGAILLSAMAAAGSGTLDATRGDGATACNGGGNGSPGRIRIDVATSDLPAVLSTNPTAVRGPHWADDIEPIQRSADFTATMYGEPNRTFAANIDGSDPVDVETDGSGVGTYDITLEPGHNRICAIVSPTADLTLPEAVRCMVVTYLP